MEYAASYASPIGPLLLLSDGENLTGLYLNRAIPANSEIIPVFRQTTVWLDAYFQGKELPQMPPIKLRGTAFQRLIWDMLPGIPMGEVRTYGDLAKAAAKILGKEKMSAQAVGQAVGKNPVSIIVPCHRIIGAGGKLTGYGGGMENKIWLLQHEGYLKKGET